MTKILARTFAAALLCAFVGSYVGATAASAANSYQMTNKSSHHNVYGAPEEKYSE